MLYSYSLSDLIEETREELFIADSNSLTKRVKDFFKESVMPAKEKLFLLTLASKLYVESIRDRKHKLHEGMNKYERVKEFINTYMENVNIYNFRGIYHKKSGTFGFTLIIYLNNNEDVLYKISRKAKIDELKSPTITDVLDDLMRIDEEVDDVVEDMIINKERECNG